MGLIRAVVCRTIWNSSLYFYGAGPGSHLLDTYFVICDFDDLQWLD
jgi:hypothetical protein